MEAAALKSVIKDMKGDDFADGTTYGSAIILALTSQFPGRDDQMKGDKKFELFKLAMKVDDMMQGKDSELSTKEIETIKDRVSIYSPLMVGRIWSLLDPAGAKAEK